MGYSDRPQSLKKLEDQKKVLEYFDTHGGTIAEISDALGMSRSTVQRHLTDIDDSEKRDLIKGYLFDNRKIGNQKGGMISQELYGYSKDDDGKFTGHSK